MAVTRKAADELLVRRQLQATAKYDRRDAVAYALRQWNKPNSRYANMATFGGGGDCTNFTSQCLRAGGWPMDYRCSTYATEWWYRRIGEDSFDANENDWWSCTWAIAENHFRYLSINHGEAIDLRARPSRARALRRGDLIYYDWGSGIFGHSAIVTAHNRRGEPLVTYRTLEPMRPRRNVHWRLRYRRRAARIYGVRLIDRPRIYGTAPDWSRLLPCDRSRL